MKLNQAHVRKFAEWMERIAAALDHRWLDYDSPPTTDDFVALVNRLAAEWRPQTFSVASGGVMLQREPLGDDGEGAFCVELSCVLGRELALVEELP